MRAKREKLDGVIGLWTAVILSAKDIVKNKKNGYETAKGFLESKFVENLISYCQDSSTIRYSKKKDFQKP